MRNRGSDAGVTQQDGNPLNRDTRQEEFDRECVSEPVSMAVGNPSKVKQFSEALLPDIQYRFWFTLAGPKRELLARTISECLNHKRRQRDVDDRSCFCCPKYQPVVGYPLARNRNGVS